MSSYTFSISKINQTLELTDKSVPAGPHVYVVLAADRAKNVSAPSNAVPVTIQ